jgi:hypothetical protein
MVLGGLLCWRELPYFESARGHTTLTIEDQREGAVANEWKPILTVQLYVLPTKLGEQRYLEMAGDLEDLSRSLLADLYGKSKQTYDLRFAREGRLHHSHEEELAGIDSILGELAPILDAISRRPASRVCNVPRFERIWGTERVSPGMLTALSHRGVSPSATGRPLVIRTPKTVESFDVPEHRVVRAFLQLLLRRLTYCHNAALRHVAAITSERHLRHVRLGSGPTLFETIDVPRINRLQEAAHKARQTAAAAGALCNLPFLRDVPPELAAVRGGVFQRNAEYRLLGMTLRRFLLTYAVWYEGEANAAITKLTSRLFEQWCYLRIIESFRQCGVTLGEWSDALRQNLRSRFILDFDRGLTFEGELARNLRIRFRYEPWILGESSAVRARETLCRGASSDVAWCPDILIECLAPVESGGLHPVYGVVLDCKYTTRLQSHHWTGTSKYLEIRSATTKRQVVKQLWLVAPGTEEAIRSEDPAVGFDERGPSCRPDEAVRYVLTAVPGEYGEDGMNVAGNESSFLAFARGTISYLRREFGTGGIAS